MKRISWVVFLYALFTVFASPGWGANFAALQTAISNTADGGTLTLSESYTAGDNEKGIVISKSITIDGNGNFLDGNNKVRILLVSTDHKAVTIKNLTIKNGKLDNKDTIAKFRGGAGMFVGNTDLTLTECIFDRNINVTDNRSGADCDEGGGMLISLSGDSKPYTITITDCEFTNNSADWIGGGAQIWSKGGSTVTIDVAGCTFENNSSHIHGGGLSIVTNFVNTVSDTAGANFVSVSSIRNSVFKNNKAVVAANGGGEGGGMYLYSGNGPISADIRDCTFDSNKAKFRGGAISNAAYDDLNVIITNCLFTGNEVQGSGTTYGGGAISNMVLNYTGPAKAAIINQVIDSCTFIKNSATIGGAIYNFNRHYQHNYANQITQTIKNSTFTNNKANTNGGAIFNIIQKNTTTSSPVTHTTTQTITNCTFVNNTAENGANEFVVSSDPTTGKFTGNIVNTIFSNSGSNYFVNQDASSSATITLTNNAFSGTIPSGNGITPGSTNKVATLANASNPATQAVNGVTHTIFKLTESDTALITGGTATGAPTTDQLGYKRSTTAPSIGAVEYVTFAVSTAAALPEGTVGTAYSQKVAAAFTPAQASADLVWALDSSNTLPGGLSLDISGVISGEPTTAGDYKFTLTVKGSDDLYSGFNAKQEFTLKINAKPEVSFDIGTVTIKSTGGSSDIALELTSKDYSDLAKTSSSDLTSLKSGTLTAASSDQAKVVVTIDPGKGEISGVTCGSDDVTVSDKKFTPSKAGTYKIIFKGTDDNDNVKYFAAGFIYSITDDSSSNLVDPDDPDAVAETMAPDSADAILAPTTGEDENGNTTSTIPANMGIVLTLIGDEWTFPFDLLKEVIAAAQYALDKLLDTDRVDTISEPESDGKYKKLGAKLKKAVYPGTVFIIWLIPSSSNTQSALTLSAAADNGTLEGYMIVQGTDAEESVDELEIDTTTLKDSETNDTLNVTAGNYKVSYSSLNGEVTGGLSEVALSGNTGSGGEEEEDDDDGNTSSKGSSGGCDTGAFGIMAMLVVAAFNLKLKIKK